MFVGSLPCFRNCSCISVIVSISNITLTYIVLFVSSFSSPKTNMLVYLLSISGWLPYLFSILSFSTDLIHGFFGLPLWKVLSISLLSLLPIGWRLATKPSFCNFDLCVAWSREVVLIFIYGSSFEMAFDRDVPNSVQTMGLKSCLKLFSNFSMFSTL